MGLQMNRFWSISIWNRKKCGRCGGILRKRMRIDDLYMEWKKIGRTDLDFATIWCEVKKGAGSMVFYIFDA